MEIKSSEPIDFDDFSKHVVEFANFYSENSDQIRAILEKYGDKTQHLIDLAIGQLQYFMEWEGQLKRCESNSE